MESSTPESSTLEYHGPDWDGEAYIYAIASADSPLPDGLAEGIDAASLSLVQTGRLSAIVSQTPDGKLRPRRRNLKAHHSVINGLMNEQTILPMSFGIIADSPGAVAQLLDRQHEPLVSRLESVDGAVEVGLRMNWAVDDIFQFFVSQDDELRQIRDEHFGSGQQPSRQARIDVGRAFKQRLDQRRQAHVDTLRDKLDDHCREIVADDLRDDDQIANLALLVDRSAVDPLEERIHAMAEDYSDEYGFEYTDPLAPFSFVDLEL